jgi:two-component system, cell cycle sensor histidine kinase and response regulator CckA
MYPDKKRILFADDDLALGGITKLSLEHCGYEVRTVHSGFEALQAFSKSPRAFDLVILDQEMPDIKGTEVAARLSTLRPGMPILLYTGCQDGDLAVVARAVGIKEIAAKSLAIEELLCIIDRTVFETDEELLEYGSRAI